MIYKLYFRKRGVLLVVFDNNDSVQVDLITIAESLKNQFIELTVLANF